MKKTFITLLTLTMLVSCASDEIKDVAVQKNIQKREGNLFEELFHTEKELALKDFSIAFEKVVSQSPQLRRLLKTEALKETCNDTEVLIAMIKDAPLEQGTFEERINLNLPGGKLLKDIFNVIPTVTVLVPELPEESFNAERWNAENEIPVIGIRLPSTNNIPVVGSNSNTGVLPYDITPAFPILVVKLSERIVSNFDGSYSDIEEAPFFNSSYGINYKFKDIAFDGINFPTVKFFELRDPTVLEQAYEYYKNTDGWQRDHVYYRINPTNLNGPIQYDYSEHIGTIDTRNDPEGLYFKIADQKEDPHYSDLLCSDCEYKFNPWSDGRFEFKFKVVMNSKSGGGTYINKYISVKGSEIFDLTYSHRVDKWLWTERNFFDLQSVAGKTFIANREIFNWDLRSKSVEIQVSVFEEDASEEIIISDSFDSNYASNFSSTDKEGMKYGSSMQAQASSNFMYRTLKGSDAFDEDLINFGDKIYISKRPSILFGSHYTKRFYGGSLLKYTIEPRKVQ